MLQNTRNYPFEFLNNENSQYVLNKIIQKELPAPRFGHAATKYNNNFLLFNFSSIKYIFLDTIMAFSCMEVN